LHNERASSVAEEVGVADEEEFRLEFYWFAEMDSLECASADEIAFGVDAYRS